MAVEKSTFTSGITNEITGSLFINGEKKDPTVGSLIGTIGKNVLLGVFVVPKIMKFIKKDSKSNLREEA
jgi:hypothetical protein